MTDCFGCLPNNKKQASFIFEHRGIQYALCGECCNKAIMLGWKVIRPIKLGDKMTRTVKP